MRINEDPLCENIAELTQTLKQMANDNEKLQIELKLKKSDSLGSSKNDYKTKLKDMERQLQKLQILTSNQSIEKLNS